MPVINFPDGSQADISDDDISLWFGDRRMATITNDNLVQKLRDIDKAHGESLIYKVVSNDGIESMVDDTLMAELEEEDDDIIKNINDLDYAIEKINTSRDNLKSLGGKHLTPDEAKEYLEAFDESMKDLEQAIEKLKDIVREME